MVKLKVKTIKTNNPEEVEYTKTHAEIVQTPLGTYELIFPTNLNKKLKPHMGKDFDMDVVQEGDTLKVILTRDKTPQEMKLDK